MSRTAVRQNLPTQIQQKSQKLNYVYYEILKHLLIKYIKDLQLLVGHSLQR